MMNKPDLPTDKQLEMIRLSAEINNLKAVRLLDKSMSKTSSWRRASLSSLVVILGLSAALLIQPYKPVAANIQPLPAVIKQGPVDLNPAQLEQIIKAVKPVTEIRYLPAPKKAIAKHKVVKAKTKKAKPSIAVKSEPFIPEIDRTCPAGYARVQPHICFNNKEKMMIYLPKPKPTRS
jgi:hypothetical protein